MTAKKAKKKNKKKKPRKADSASPRRNRRGLFLASYSLAEAYLLKPGRATGVPGIIEGTAADGNPVLTHFESRHFLTLLWLPPADDATRTEAWLYEGRAKQDANWKAVLSRNRDESPIGPAPEREHCHCGRWSATEARIDRI